MKWNNLKKGLKVVGRYFGKHKHEFLFAGGVAGVLGGTTLACIQTYKYMPGIVENHKKKMSEIDICTETGLTSDGEKYEKKDRVHDEMVLWKNTLLSSAKVYAIPAAVEFGGIASFGASEGFFKKEVAGLTNTVGLLASQNDRLKNYIQEKLSKTDAMEAKFDARHETIEETVVDEKGKEKTVKKDVTVVPNELDLYSNYAKFFDESCCGWTKNPEYNRSYLELVQRECNSIIRNRADIDKARGGSGRGFMFLNEVYKKLGIPETKAGHEVGWIYDESSNEFDNYIDFGLYDVRKESVRDFMNGYERTILLDFNVDGDILKYLDDNLGSVGRVLGVLRDEEKATDRIFY